MTELEMLEKLEQGRKDSEEGFTVYAMANGKDVALSLDKEDVKRMKGFGYWICSIFENGHRVEA